MFKTKFKKINSTEFQNNNCLREECIHNEGIVIYWYKNNKLHREDGPAVEFSNGKHLEWMINDEHHRNDGPAIICEDGTQAWYYNGSAHREDGPAIIRADGTKEWYFNGKLHRVDGPAIESPDGNQEWWENGVEIRKVTFDLKALKILESMQSISKYYKTTDV